MMTPDEIIQVVRAYQNGDQIEVHVKNSSTWRATNDPHWNFLDCDYRAVKSPVAKGHNPRGISESVLDVKNGWRLLELGEVILETDAFLFSSDVWVSAGTCAGEALKTPSGTFRTKRPLSSNTISCAIALQENPHKKFGVNNPPTTQRPSPPVGQGNNNG